MTYIDETGRKVDEYFREHLKDIHTEDSKPVSLHFNCPDNHGEADILATALKSCNGGQNIRCKI